MGDFGDEMRKAIDDMARDMLAAEVVPPPADHDGPTITIRKIGHTQPVSFETLIREGAMTEEEALAKGWPRPERDSTPRWRRLRWALSWWWLEHRPHVHLGPCDHGDCA